MLVRPTAVQNDLERRRLGGVSEGVVGLHDVVETESMRDESSGTKLAGLHQFEQQWRRDGVDQARGERDVAVPQFLECNCTGLPWTPMFAMRPPAPTMAWQVSNAAGVPTASIARSTPAPSVIAKTRATASSAALFTTDVAPNSCAF